MTTTITVTKRIVSVVLALVFCASLSLPVFAAEKLSEDDPKVVAAKEAMEEAQAKVDAAKAKSDALQGSINEAKASAYEIQQEVNALQAEIDAYQNQINVIQANMDVIDADIEATEDKMQDQQNQISATQELLGQRLRAMYMAGNYSTIELIFEADNFENLLNRLELVAQITQHDNKIVEQLKSDIKALQKMAAKLEEEKAELQESKDSLAAAQQTVKDSKSVVDAKLAKFNAALAKLNAEDAEYQKIMQQGEKEKAEQAQTVYNLMNGIEQGSGATGLIWPVKQGGYISSNFGPRWGRSHNGIDITIGGAAAHNIEIVAAQAGKVISVVTGCSHVSQYGDTCGGGYGNYIVIDHGEGTAIWYAHLYSVNVSVGQYVAKGQTIGIMGSSGSSTGYHLHFEIHINGTAVNPLNYVSQ